MKVMHLCGPAPLCTNSFVVITEKKNAVIIDPAADAAQYIQCLRQENASLTHIFCTHGHYDHVGAAQALRQEWGAKLYCDPADVQGTEMFPLCAADSGFDAPSVTVDELTFRVWHTPGHSKGSVCILCGDYFFTGDTLFAGDTGRTDLPGGSHSDMVASCCKLKALALPPDTKILPGHEDFSTYGYEMKHNGFVCAFCD